MTANDWLEQLFKSEYFSGNFEHLKELIDQFDLAPRDSKIITIAGTNGKGETARTLTFYLAQNHCVKMWSSPHLISVTERFSTNNSQIEEQELVEIFNELKNDLGPLVKSLSYFEFLFLSFLKWVKKSPCEFVVLEVGLGGRLDATNALDANITCVTSIARDHQDLLGHRLEKILLEKLGIRRNHTPLITAFELDYLKLKTKKILGNSTVDWSDLFTEKKISRTDSFSTRNRVMAQEICRKLGVLTGDNAPSYAARSSFSLNNSEYVLFPSHNPDGLRKLVQFLAQHQYNNWNLVLVSFSKRELKDLRVGIRVLINFFGKNKIKLIDFNHIKSVDKGLLEKIQNEFGLKVIKEEDIFKQQLSCNSKILITGSNYLLGNVLKQCPGK